MEPLAGGWANDVYVVEGDAGRAVLRLKHPPSDPESIRWEHDVVARVAETVPEVVVPLRGHDGSTFFLFGGDAAWLVPHVDGAPADGDRDEQRVAAARLLGRLHTATADVDAPPRPGVDGLAQLRALGAGGLRPEWRRRVATLHAASLRTLHELERRDAVRGVVHGDFFPGNVLVRGDRVVALIDWEEAHVAPLVYDLATGVWEFSKSELTHDFDRAAAARFVDAYRDAGGPVAPSEEDLLVPLIRAKRVLELLRAPTDRYVDWRYQEHNLRAAERLA